MRMNFISKLAQNVSNISVAKTWKNEPSFIKERCIAQTKTIEKEHSKRI